jgi:hypothetical protein
VNVRDVNREDRLRRTWQSLFMVPEGVTFEPYCPTSALAK